MRRARARGRALARRYGHAQPAIGKGAKGYLYAHHKYAIVGLVPNRQGTGYLKTRYVIGRARDAHEALMELIQHQATQAQHYGQARWKLVVLDVSAGKGKLAPIVTESELRARAVTGG